MTKFKLINKKTGVSKASGKPWANITLASDVNGNRNTNDFFISPTVYTKVNTIPLDSYVFVSADLDADLHFAITDIRLADTKATV